MTQTDVLDWVNNGVLHYCSYSQFSTTFATDSGFLILCFCSFVLVFLYVCGYVSKYPSVYIFLLHLVSFCVFVHMHSHTHVCKHFCNSSHVYNLFNCDYVFSRLYNSYLVSSVLPSNQILSLFSSTILYLLLHFLFCFSTVNWSHMKMEATLFIYILNEFS